MTRYSVRTLWKENTETDAQGLCVSPTPTAPTRLPFQDAHWEPGCKGPTATLWPALLAFP